MIEMAPFEHVYWNLLFRSNKSGGPSFDSLWCVCACGQLMHLNVIMNRCALVTSVRFMILCIASAPAPDGSFFDRRRCERNKGFSKSKC